MGDTIAYLLDTGNKFLQTTTWGSSTFTPDKRKAFDGLPLGDSLGTGGGEIGVKVHVLTYQGSSIAVTLNSIADGSAYPSTFGLVTGAKAVTFSTFGPAYSAGTEAALAMDRVTGGLLVQNVKGPATPTSTNVSANAASVTLLASNAARIGGIIKNGGSTVLHITFAATSTVDASSYDLAAYGSSIGGLIEIPFRYTGVISGIWEGAPTGKANITELTQ